MLILLKFVFSIRHSGADPDLLMVVCDQRCKEAQGGSCFMWGCWWKDSSGVVWVFSKYVVSRAIVELGQSSQFTPHPPPLPEKKN